jgi:RNA polymerase sigma factor (sigma-70 family)
MESRTFSHLRDRLRAKKYNPLPKEELHRLVLAKENPEKVVMSLQRLVIRAMGSFLRFEEHPDELLFELFQVGLVEIYDSFMNCTNIKVSFAPYVYTNMRFRMFTYLKQKEIIKPRIVKGEYAYAQYFYSDAETEDYWHPIEEDSISDESIDFQLIKGQLLKHKIKERDIDVYFYFLSSKLTYREVGEKFNITMERARQICNKVEKTIKDSEKITRYLKEFLN